MAEYRKDEYKKVRIPFGFNEKLEKVFLSLFHTFFVAMTGHGKTLGMKSLLLRFHELFPDWKILIIDSKDKRDYADLHADIPICFVEATDPLDLKNLMEPIVGAKMMYYFDKIIEEATFDTLGEIQRSIHKKVVDADEGRIKIHGKELGKLRVLDFTLAKLVALIEKPNIISELKLHEGFNVMPVSLPDVKNPNLKRAFQQLIARSALLLLLADPLYERTLLVLDENHKWNPQRYSSICKQPLSEFISEGRSQDKIVWLSDQALTKIDKEALKNVKIWVVGQQMEDNEVEDARNAVNSITDLSVTDKEIKTLKIGNFILVDGLHRTVEKVYLQPYGTPDEITQQIAKGADPELAEPYIFKFESKLRKSMEIDEDLIYKEKYEELLRQFERRVAEEREKAFKEAMDKFEEMKKTLNVEELRETIMQLKDDKEALEEVVKKAQEDLAVLDEIKQVMGKLFPTVQAVSVPTEAMSTMPGMTVADVDERINQRLGSGPSPIPVVSVDVDQRIKELVRNEVVNRIVTKIEALPEPAKKAAWWLHERKQATVKDLYNFVYGGQTEFTGRAVGLFSANVVTPLADAWLIVKENGNIRWALQEKLQAELRDVLNNSDIEKVPKYLASLLL
jgi:hypothetical protein